jgi:predicted glycogen debranching enzyme
MLPNRFPDQGSQPEFNAVDASLWFVVAVHQFLQAAQKARFALNGDRTKLLAAIEAVLDGYSQGARYGIRADSDGLLMAGERGVQLTWMDAKVGEWVVTPRAGKPVEVQALWLNALWIASQHDNRWKEPLQRGRASFQARFWNPDRKMLYDVVDVNHQRGTVDASFRPNQIFAVGGLPLRLIEDNRAFLIVEAVKNHLWTPLGLRSLAPGEPGYTPRYRGGVRERDGAYHQGTIWPWLLGAFVDAWVWLHKRTPAAIREARREYFQPLLDHLEEAGLGHISEIADAEAPHTPRGCPWQAWSVGEALWLDQVVLAEPIKALAARKSSSLRPIMRNRQLAPA